MQPATTGFWFTSTLHCYKVSAVKQSLLLQGLRPCEQRMTPRPYAASCTEHAAVPRKICARVMTAWASQKAVSSHSSHTLHSSATNTNVEGPQQHWQITDEDGARCDNISASLHGLVVGLLTQYLTCQQSLHFPAVQFAMKRPHRCAVSRQAGH